MSIENNIVSFFREVTKNKYKVYYDSVCAANGNIFFIVKGKNQKFLISASKKATIDELDGDFLFNKVIDNSNINFSKSCLNIENLNILRNIFPHLNPTVCGSGASFGTGDRLGLVTASHIKTFKNKDIFPILAQQSVRELTRTGRNWQNVINDTLWGYFESGSRKPFGADADHVKEASDLKEAVDSGFTMFTVDPSEYIQGISNLNKSEIIEKYYSLDNFANLEKKYLDKNLKLGEKEYFINQDILIPTAVRYKEAIDYVSSLYGFLKDNKKEKFDFEVSMDEIEERVTPLEHYFIAGELKNKGVDFQNLAIRYIGRWEKAIDYIGDIKIFEKELKEHIKVLKKFGGYKLSLHSGSEKFSTYRVFSEINEGNFHVKTAGTSWLEALRLISKSSPMLFREIFSYSLKCFEKDRDSYHLTTNLEKLPDIGDVLDTDLTKYLDMAESRQILHVTFGSILTSKDKNEKFLFRKKIYSELFKNENLHYEYVASNIRKHLDLLTN